MRPDCSSWTGGRGRNAHLQLLPLHHPAVVMDRVRRGEGRRGREEKEGKGGVGERREKEE